MDRGGPSRTGRGWAEADRSGPERTEPDRIAPDPAVVAAQGRDAGPSDDRSTTVAGMSPAP